MKSAWFDLMVSVAVLISLLMALFSDHQYLHDASLLLYLAVCMVGLYHALLRSVASSTIVLTTLIVYEPITPHVLTELPSVFLEVYLSLILLILLLRRPRFYPPALVYALVALVGTFRFFTNGTVPDATGTLPYIVFGLALSVYSGWRPLQWELLRVIAQICLSVAFVAAISIAYYLHEGWLSLIALQDTKFRLGDITSLSANSFGYICAMGGLSGLVLLHSKRGNWMVVVCTAVSIGSAVLTKSYSVLIPFVVAAGYLVVSDIRSASSRVSRKVILTVFVFAAVLALYYTQTNYLSLGERDFSTLSSRTVIWERSLTLIRDNPVLGLPADDAKHFGFRVIYDSLDGVSVRDQATPHNIVLNSMLHYGIVIGGLDIGLQVFIILAFILRSVRTRTRTKHLFVVVLAGFITHLFIDPWHFIYYWLIATLALPNIATEKLVCKGEIGK